MRLDYLDIAKGLAIVLVVLGHSIPDASAATGISSPILADVFKAIYSFHMPLFFFVSGFLVVREKLLAHPKLDFFKKRFLRLMVPYFFVGMCYLPLKLVFASYANKPYDISTLWQIFIGVNPDGELWFLYVLWIISVIAMLLRYTSSLAVLILAAIWAQFSPGLMSVSGNIFFFITGMYMRANAIRPYAENITQVLIAMLLFIIGNYILYGFGYYGAIVATGISGTYLVLSLAKLIDKTQSSIRGRAIVLGFYSMDIYILSDIIKIPVRMLLWSKLHLYYPAFISCLVLSIAMALAVSKYIVRPNKYLRRCVLGMSK